MQPQKFRYTLILDSGTYVLLNAPEGWEETFLKQSRSRTYWGLIRSFTVPMKFVLDGAYLLRREFYTYGVSAKMKLKIEVLKNQNWEYQILYNGGIDFTEFQDFSNDRSVVVRATDEGIAEMIATYDKTVYEIPLTESNMINVEIPGVSLIDSAQLLVLPQPYSYAPPNINKILPCDVEENELINEKIETRISEEENNPNLSTSSNWLIKVLEDTTIVISGTIEAVFGITRNDSRVIFEIRNNSGALKGTIANVGRESGSKVDYSVTIQGIAGERLFLIVRTQGDPRGGLSVEYFPVKITNEILTEPSISKAIKAEVLFKELLVKMNGEDGGAKSDLLKGSNLFITCGDAIREFENPVLKTSFQDFYRSMDYVLNAGFGIDNVPRLETKEFFFRDSVCLDLGTVSEFSLSVETDLMYNNLRVGYKDEKYEQDQGREEFNQGQVWTTKNSKVDSTEDRISPYRADQYGIAVLRRLTLIDNLKGVDSESDNDVWMLQGSGEIIEGVYQLEKGSDLEYVTGIPNPDNAINLRLSPKNNMLRSGSFLRVGLAGFDDTLLEFASADKNADLISQIDFKIISEKQAVAVSSLRKRLFYPYVVKIKTAIPVNAWALIDANRYGYFKFRYNSNDFKGFLKDGDTDIAQNTSRELSLYLHPDTELQKLIL